MKAPAQKNLILKTDFGEPFNSTNHYFILRKTFQIHTESYEYSHSASRQPCFFFYDDKVIKGYEGTQPGDLESSTLLSVSIQYLIDSLESKLNLWYLDDGNLKDD